MFDDAVFSTVSRSLCNFLNNLEFVKNRQVTGAYLKVTWKLKKKDEYISS